MLGLYNKLQTCKQYQPNSNPKLVGVGYMDPFVTFSMIIYQKHKTCIYSYIYTHTGRSTENSNYVPSSN